MSIAPVLRAKASLPSERMLVINYSRMPWTSYPIPDCRSKMKRDGAGVLWKRWRLLEDNQLYNLDDDPMQRTNVIDQYPEVTARMRSHLNKWWNGVRDSVNEPQRVVIGDDADNPMMLTACEWLDVFVDQQIQIRQGVRNNGWWELEVAQSGEYEFELRRWPREADAALNASLPSLKVTAGELKPGKALPIAAAKIQVGCKERRKRIQPGAACVKFGFNLAQGPVRLYTSFIDENNNDICGAYYVYVHRK